MKKYAIGVDVGGSHITCAAVDLETQKLDISTRKRERVSHTDSAENIFTAWSKAIKECIDLVGEKNVAGIGFAIPGPFNYKEGISMMEHKYPALYKLHIPTELLKYLNLKGDVSMRFLNDASSFAIGVSWVGKGKGFQRVIVLTLGTGFGSAYIENELPVVEGENIAPEGCFWHLPFQEGIADNYFSTGWFVKEYKNLIGKDIAGVKEIISDDPKSAKILFEKFSDNLANFMTPWLEKFSADVLVLGGNISLAFDNFKEPLEKKLAEKNIDVKIEISELMENAAIVGASRLLEETFWKRVSKDLPKI